MLQASLSCVACQEETREEEKGSGKGVGFDRGGGVGGGVGGGGGPLGLGRGFRDGKQKTGYVAAGTLGEKSNKDDRTSAGLQDGWIE